MDTHQIRIVILDNHALVRAGMHRLIEDQAEMNVVGEAGSLSEGLDVISDLKPDIVLFEINLEARTIAEIVSRIMNASSGSRLIFVTGTNNPMIIQQAIEDGVMGVVLKTQSPEFLTKAIEKVSSGEVWLERSMIATVLSRLSHNNQSARINSEIDNINELNEREKQIINLIGQGYKNKKISIQLGLSESTVRHYLTSIYGKLEVSDRLELLIFANRYGLVKPAPS